MQATRSKTAGKGAPTRWVPGFLLWVLPLLVVTGCTGPGHSTPSAHTVSSCRPGLVPGYSNHRSYPPGIPALPPPGTRITGCFAGTGQAASRGFPLPLPRGTMIVHGVFLLPAATVMRSQCQAAARALGFAVPCPGLLPALASVPTQLPDCGTASGCVWQETTPPPFKRFLFDSQFTGPPGYNPLGVPGLGHVALLAEQASAVISANDRLVFCLGRAPIRRLTIDGSRATMTACPEGSYETGGHLLLRWVHRGVLAAVTFHGINATNVDLDVAVARHMTWVSPHS